MKRLLPLIAIFTISTIVSSCTKNEVSNTPNAEKNIFYSTNEDLMTDVTKVNIVLLSETTVLDSIGNQKQARIMIRCNGNELNTAVVTPTFNADNLEVQLRWDEKDPKTKYWSYSVDGTAYFPFPLVYKDKLLYHQEFIEDIRNHDSLVFGWSPYSSEKKAVKFDLKKIKPKIERAMVDGCIFE